MQWSLFVLVLMGQCSLCVCCLYEYHFVEEKKTWKEAQAYCRRNYTDLATVFDLRDVKRLNKSKEKRGGDAWIGLSKHTNVNRTWHWSQSGLEFNDNETKWYGEEPNNKEGNENCVSLLKGKWVDSPCSTKKGFICYDETTEKKFHLIKKDKTWRNAQKYCRDEHTDLVSGLTQLKDQTFHNESKAGKEFWIGLFADTWRWSDDSNFSFRHWHEDPFVDEKDNKTCAMTRSNGTWSTDECNEKKNFFCYDDDVILINKKMTWERALTYCRENYYELVSITTPKEQRWVQERAKKANSTHVWMGLRFTCTLEFWFWVTDEVVKYKNWGTQETMDECDMSGAMETGGQHKWFKKNANTQFNFICFK